ncbi:Nucleolar protein 12-like protein [Leptotrombidium deliense]|uniref:Nucleolar protein 12 n=1 Tax=Leptotrombidium deliense TaxID=299467 RepID=A0A443S695_9ACAR|nr:Nucleolar protein 12-like protein [Leptotrombidium deliense]
MGKKKKSKKPKVNLIFDEKERKEYLLGFRKRNLEKKQKAKEKMLKRLKEAKSRIKREKKEENSKLVLNGKRVPEVEHLIEPVVYDLPNHSVVITHLDPNEIGGNIDYTLGTNTGL